MKIINSRIFNEFNVNVRRWRKFHGFYICESSKGDKALYISQYTPAQIQMEYNIKQHLINNKFTSVDQLDLSNKGTPYVIYNKEAYIMKDYKNGQLADFYNIEHIKESMELLAKMHIAGKDFTTIPHGFKMIEIKNLAVTYNKRYKETIKLRKRIEHQSRMTDFEVEYLKNSQIYQRFQEKASQYIQADNYDKLIDREKNSIYHGNYTYHNISKISKGQTTITGFEKSSYNVQILDLVYISKKILQRNQWNPELLLNIMEIYNKIKPLTKDEWLIVKGMMIFPQRFSKLCNQYYNSKRRWNYNMFDRKFTKMLKHQDDYIKCIEQVMKW